MRPPVRAAALVLALVVSIFLSVGSVRWAKRHHIGAQVLASAMLLVLGIAAPIPNPPQQKIEEAREDKDRKGGESGDPPEG